MHYLSGSLKLLASIPLKFWEIDFGDCHASDLGCIRTPTMSESRGLKRDNLRLRCKFGDTRLMVGYLKLYLLFSANPESITRCERDFFIDNLLVQIHYIIVMIRWTGLAPWEFELSFPGSLISNFLVYTLWTWWYMTLGASFEDSSSLLVCPPSQPWVLLYYSQA